MTIIFMPTKAGPAKTSESIKKKLEELRASRAAQRRLGKTAPTRRGSTSLSHTKKREEECELQERQSGKRTKE